MSDWLTAGGIGLILLGGAATLGLASRRGQGERLFRWAALGGGTMALIGLSRGASFSSASPVPILGRWYAADGLSAWFLVMVLGVGAVTAAYGVPYLREDGSSRRVVAAHALVAVLIAALAGVVTATTPLSFLVAWEVMAVSAYFLVIYEHRDVGVRRAALIYLVLTHASTLALFGMFASWGPGSLGQTFAELAATKPDSVGLILVFALLGFGIKAGIVPFHFWLPGAHAAAPSHVSALLSGVVLKSGVYGLLRILGLVEPPSWWGWIVLVVGVASAILGVLWALAQHDLKRLLAYHSVENIGIIFIGLGIGALGSAYGHPAIAVLGYAGALLHALNHALFKSLLFLGAGVIARVGGTREIDRLGGLARRIPRTALAFGIGSVAIVGLPPLNGFVSEWVIFQALVRSAMTDEALRLAGVGAAGLALTGGLALACFAKLHGIVFLGRERVPARPSPPEPESGMLGPQIVLALGCIAIGVVPLLVAPEAARLAAAPAHLVAIARGLPGDDGALVRLSLGAGALVVLGLVLWAATARAVRRRWAPGTTWACAYPVLTARMQYTATSFAAPLLSAFRAAVPSHEVRTPTGFHVEPRDPVLDVVGSSLWRRLLTIAARARVIQTGRIRWYVLYVIVTLLVLLVYLGLAGSR